MVTPTVVVLTFQQDPTGFWSVRSPDLPDGSELVTGDWDFDAARRLAWEAVAFALDADGVPAHVELIETLPDRR